MDYGFFIITTQQHRIFLQIVSFALKLLMLMMKMSYKQIGDSELDLCPLAMQSNQFIF